MEPYIQTYTGKEFWFFQPDPESIDIEDIAHSLSLKCRYNGHCSKFYSVAEHSVITAQILKNLGSANVIQMTGLLHEGSEPYISDIPTPIKQFIPGLTKIENKILEVICQKYEISYPFPPEIKKVDLGLLHAEMLVMMNEPSTPWDLPEPPVDVTFHFWDPSEAEIRFLEYYYFLKENLE